MNDAVSQLRALRPALPEYEPDDAALERILLEPPLAPRPRAPHRRARTLALGCAVALAALAVALAPSLRDDPDVVARAAAALNDPSTILHLKWVDAAGNTMESWQADRGLKMRWLYRGGTDKAVESAEDLPAKSSLSYSAERDEVITHTEPDLFDLKNHPPRSFADGQAFGDARDDLAGLLERARKGEGNAQLIGETTVRDQPAYEIRIVFPFEVTVLPRGFSGDPRTLAKRTIHITRTILVNRDTFLPVRVVEQWPGAKTATTHDYVEAERLPMTPENERLLKLAPHPGAKQVVEGRV